MPVFESKLQTSKILNDFLQNHAGERVYLREILNELGKTSNQGSGRFRAFAPLLLICALPEALPLPVAGVSAIIGIPLMFISGQFFLGFSKPWLPKWIRNRSLKKNDFEKVTNQIIRILHKSEHIIHPRWHFFTSPIFQRFLGLLLFILAVIIALPIPFGNLPPAIAIVIISLGMIEQDGLVICIGSLGGSAILAIVASIIIALFSLTSQKTK